MKTLNVIGAGRVGRTLASLWHKEHTFAIRDVLNGTLRSAQAAVAFIGGGHAVSAPGEMRAADLWMLTLPDDGIARCAGALGTSGLLRAGDIVFHCSGALPSQVLERAATGGALMASVHPLKSFADPRDAARTFAGVHCAAEGDAAALDILRPAFESIGARVSGIDPAFKTIYHAASVIVCNDLVALMEAGLRCYGKSGIVRETALAMMEPLVRETVDNVFRLGTAQSLTGPVARGDHAVVAQQVEALETWDARIGALYRELGAVALDLAREQGGADAEALDRLHDILDAGGRR